MKGNVGVIADKNEINYKLQHVCNIIFHCGNTSQSQFLLQMIYQLKGVQVS